MIGDSGAAAALLIDAIAHLMQSAPAGVHYQLIIDGGGDNDLAAIATALIARDVAPRHLMVGTDAVNADLRFSFLLLEGDDEPAFGRLESKASP
jgi:streptomycin 6-kinase